VLASSGVRVVPAPARRPGTSLRSSNPLKKVSGRDLLEGIGRACFYRWLKGYTDEGLEGSAGPFSIAETNVTTMSWAIS
jgi:hypothetical protein